MLTIEQTVDIPVDGHVHVDFTLPKTANGKKATVTLSVQESSADAAEWAEIEKHRERLAGYYRRNPTPRTIEEALEDAERKYAARMATGKDPLEGLCGSLKDVFTEDGVVLQRRLRSEWPD